jgi:glycosyltransferase involved in cell wall biosynthesis
MLEQLHGAPGDVAAADDTWQRERTALAVVGMSISTTCGMRDHATLLAAELERGGTRCSMHWLSREKLSFARSRAQVHAWAHDLAGELAEERPAAALLHYSPFAYGHRGLPLHLHTALVAIRRAKLPVLCVAHELAYPWGRAGPRGRAWAVSQRAGLLELLGSAQAMLVTADFQRDWLATRRWLPRRPMQVAPVFSNLPAPSAALRPPGDAPVIGVFGYAYQGAERSVVLDALALLRTRGSSARLLLLGAPGPASATAEEWLAAARAKGVDQLLAFHGPLPAQQLSNELAGCDVLVSCARLGPSSRKGTLAGSLASGAALVALDGPLRWQELLDARAAEVVAPTPQALADALARLLSDAPARAALGSRGREFAQTRMGVARTAEAVLALLAETGDAGAFSSAVMRRRAARGDHAGSAAQGGRG